MARPPGGSTLPAAAGPNHGGSGSGGAVAGHVPRESECEFFTRLTAGTVQISLSSSGREVACASNGGPYLIQLDRKDSGKDRHFRCWRVAGPKLSPGVSRVAFNPFDDRQLAMASGRSLCLVDVDTDRAGASGGDAGAAALAPVGALKHTYSANLRSINAIDWSPHDRHFLASCAEDCRFFIWDFRLQLPVQALLAPASWTCAVRWSPLDEHLLATGHEDAVCIWDKRKPEQQMSVLAPGQQRVMALDWSFHQRGRLLSVSAQDVWMRGAVEEEGAAPGAPTSEGAAPGAPTSDTPRVRSTGSGSIKVWDISSGKNSHESFDVDQGLPGTARFAPFGSAIIASVDSSVIMFSLQRGGGGSQRAQVLEHFGGHTQPVGAVELAHQPGGPADEWRLLSFSRGDQCLRGWRFRTPEAVKQSSGAGLFVLPTPGFDRSDWSIGDEGDKVLGHLTDQAKAIRRIPCVDEVTSYLYKEGDKVEYQLFVEINTRNNISTKITIGVDPSSHATRQALRDAHRRNRGGNWYGVGSPTSPKEAPSKALRTQVDWEGEWAGRLDGPLAPGVVGQTFRHLDVGDLFRGGEQLQDRIKGLIGMLHRRDGPPQLAGVTDEEEMVDGKSAVAAKKLPFPRTCGVCWSPHGHLLYFRSLQNVKVPKMRWSATDFQSIMKKHKEKVVREVLRDEDDEHTTAAENMRICDKVSIVLTSALCQGVEDHWWTIMAPEFLFEPSLQVTHISDVCRHNRAAAARIGRWDLAEVWRLACVLAEAAGGTAAGLRARPFASRLVRQMLHQLFDAQETLTVAMLGSVLLQLMGPGAGCDDSAPSAGAGDAAEQQRRRRVRRPWRPRELRQDLKGQPALAPRSVSDLQRSYFTWNCAPSQANDLAGLRGRTLTSSASRAGTLQAWPRSAESTVNSMMLPSDGGSGEDAALGGRWSLSLRPDRPPVVRHEAPSDGLLDLVAKDDLTLERLLHSAHAHCELMHRLGQFCASRALAKMLFKLRSSHDLPLLDEDIGLCGRLSAVRLPAHPMRRIASSVSVRSRTTPNSEEALTPAAGGPRPALICALCCLRAQSLFTPCWNCGHGFHLSCFGEWFTSADQKCPCIGCGCRCLQHRTK